MLVSILNYGLGNHGSILRMIQKSGGRAEYISTSDEILRAQKIILPGVGHFDEGMNALVRQDLITSLRRRVVVDGVPVLGICLGMQMLCSKSQEGNASGLGFVDAEVVKFCMHTGYSMKVPHMGWCDVEVVKSNPLLQSDCDEQRFYFVHSYHVVPNNDYITIAIANYGYKFCAAFQNDNIFGVQFHPEKSHRFGMNLMKRFLDL